MPRALAERLVFALGLVVLAFVGAFLLTAVAPGDPLAGRDSGPVTARALEAERIRLGLHRPVRARLGERLAGLARLDLGTSLRFDRPVRPLVLERTAATLRAGGTALALALLVGLPVGVITASSRRRSLRVSMATVSLVLLSTPALVIALLFAVSGAAVGLSPFVVMTVSLAIPAAALLERVQARAMADALRETSLQAARARGLSRARVTWSHAWPLSLPAVFGIAGILAGQLLSGALVVELVTAQSGLGLLTYEALAARDTNLAAGCAGMAALLVGVTTFVADALQLWCDPRTREPSALASSRGGRIPAAGGAAR